MKKLNIAALLLAASAPAVACDSLLFGGWSYHYDRSKDHNENHKMIGLQCKGVSVIRFKNSHSRTSFGVGYEHMPWSVGPVDFGGYAGLWTGYKKYDPVMPVAGARARVNVGNLGLVTTVGPKLAGFHLEYRF